MISDRAKTRLRHPEILATPAASGHFSQVLIAYGNFPVASGRRPNARVVHLNLAPGMLDAVTVLDVLLGVIPVQAATVMLVSHDEAFPDKITETDWHLAREEGGDTRLLVAG